MGRLRQEYHTLEIPDDGDPRWQILLTKYMTRVAVKFAPLPDGPVSGMECAFVVRRMIEGGYEETIYLFATKDAERLAIFASPFNWEKFEAYCLVNPSLSTIALIEKLERKEIPL